MATTNHVSIPNIPTTFALGSTWAMIRFTRALKKAGYRYLASGGGSGGGVDKTGNPYLDKWGFFGSGASQASHVGASVLSGLTASASTAASRGRAPITGLASVTSAHKGCFFHVTSGTNAGRVWQIEEIVSSSSIKVNALDSTNPFSTDAGPFTWVIRDPTVLDNPLVTTWSLLANGAHWTGRGPSVLKLPIAAASVGTFQRGENIVQATTGAEGELLGYVSHPETLAGYLIVAPRVRGINTPIVAHGWESGYAITGSVTGATVTQSAAANETYFDVTVYFASTTQGQIYVGPFDPSLDGLAETQWSLGYKAQNAAGVTESVAPGQGGTNNSFPARAWASWSTGSTPSTSTNQTWFNGTLGFAHAFVADAIQESGYSADGSFQVWGSVPSVNGGSGHGLVRLDGVEDGDQCHFAGFNPGYTEAITANTRATGAVNNGVTDLASTSGFLYNSTDKTFFKTWMRLNLTGEYFSNLEAAVLQARQTGPATFLFAQNTSVPMRAVHDPQSSLDTVNLRIEGVRKRRDRITLVAAGNSFYKAIKGSPRWLFLVQAGAASDVYDGLYAQMSSSNPAVVVGPSPVVPVYLA